MDELDVFEDIYDCTKCIAAGRFCYLHHDKHLEDVKAGLAMRGDPKYLRAVCDPCLNRGKPCPRHGGLPVQSLDLPPPPRPEKQKRRWDAGPALPKRVKPENDKAAITSKSPDECGYCLRFGKPCARHGGTPSRNFKGAQKSSTDESDNVRHSEKTIKTPLNTPTDDKKGGFRDAFKAILVEILLERYADQVTAKEVMDRLAADK